MVVAAACGGLVWHGGFREGAQLALAAVALCTLALWPAAWPEPLWIAGGLSLAALADAAAFALHGGSLGTLAAGLAVPALLAVAAAEPAALDRWLLPALAVTAATVATAGLAGLVLRSPPLAERIAGLWRAGGTLEYPPALGLVCVCGLAAVLALHAAGVLDLGPALVAGGILVAGAAATFDRVTAIEVLGLLALCVVRLPDARTASIALALGAAIAGAIALAAAGDGDAVSRHLRHGPISSREAVWGDAATAISERPFTGRGPGAFPTFRPSGIPVIPPTPTMPRSNRGWMPAWSRPPAPPPHWRPCCWRGCGEWHPPTPAGWRRAWWPPRWPHPGSTTSRGRSRPSS